MDGNGIICFEFWLDFYTFVIRLRYPIICRKAKLLLVHVYMYNTTGENSKLLNIRFRLLLLKSVANKLRNHCNGYTLWVFIPIRNNIVVQFYQFHKSSFTMLTNKKECNNSNLPGNCNIVYRKTSMLTACNPQQQTNLKVHNLKPIFTKKIIFIFVHHNLFYRNGHDWFVINI